MQALLPHFLLGSYHVPRLADVAAMRPRLPPNVCVLLRQSACVSVPVFVEIMRLLGRYLGPPTQRISPRFGYSPDATKPLQPTFPDAYLDTVRRRPRRETDIRQGIGNYHRPIRRPRHSTCSCRSFQLLSASFGRLQNSSVQSTPYVNKSLMPLLRSSQFPPT